MSMASGAKPAWRVTCDDAWESVCELEQAYPNLETHLGKIKVKIDFQ